MRIGIDIDGVVADSFPAWLEELNRYFGRNVPAITDYQIHELFNVSWEAMDRFFSTQKEKLFMMPEPITGAREGIENFLSEGHEIVYITARWPDEESVTRRWMKKYEIPHQDMIFTGHQEKAEVVKEKKLDMFIEDYLLNAQKIAQTGTTVLLLDALYNRAKDEERIIRCQNWPEINRSVKGLAEREKDK